MGKRRYREKVRSPQRRIREHRSKINRERLKSAPDEGLVRHWEREVRAFEDGIGRARRRMGREG
jgi:hypothetical protein